MKLRMPTAEGGDVTTAMIRAAVASLKASEPAYWAWQERKLRHWTVWDAQGPFSWWTPPDAEARRWYYLFLPRGEETE